MITKDYSNNRLMQTHAAPELNTLSSEALLYQCAHGIGAPLKTMSGLLNLLEHNNDEKLSALYLNLVMATLGKMRNFLAEVDELMTSVMNSAQYKPVTLSDTAMQVLDTYKSEMEVHNIACEVNIQQSSVIYGVESRIRFILNQCIHNAIAFRKDKNTPHNIRINISADEHFTLIRIADNGIGMSEYVKRNLFKPFFRGSENSRGVGLGLFVVRTIVQSMKGEITVLSEAEKGSVFSIAIPRCANVNSAFDSKCFESQEI